MIFKVHATVNAPAGTDSTSMARAVLEVLDEGGWDVLTVTIDRNSGGKLVSEAHVTRSAVITNAAAATPAHRSMV